MDAALRSLLDWYASVGVDVPDIAPPRAVRKRRVAPVAPESKAPLIRKAEPKRELAQSTPVAAATQTLDALRSAITSFDAGALSDGARQAVFARGNPDANLMVIGEAPGKDEDIQGKPFVGPAGQLLDVMLGAIALGRDDFYITNVVNWRPPKNRNPNKGEVEICLPFLHRHITLAKPKILLLVGGVSMTALTGETAIMKNHGQWRDVEIDGVTYPSLTIYHPAFLLRRPELKKDAWRDLLMLRERLLSL